ncbi:nuclear transport factor 2 family protein [Alginatibacterium sediminis]|uniref:Nuclear transport factor 2 family protein n=1 Tax=Alginatibacterium sediminis TaxID=2164068 RepID=A0A420E8Q4_9ALTE|nr:nuclear transport factor 2 family protein [Alginatibacterium sediminis]RKF15708.1 nuclear transport factor 2 family protein [Alginatibacterium sediminis]
MSVCESLTQQGLERFIELYQQLNKDNLHRLHEIYAPQVEFSDPMHQIDGLDNLSKYFEQLYLNLEHCEFVIEQSFIKDSSASLVWTMNFKHPKLNKGQIVCVPGMTHLQFQDDKIIYHRDYLDSATMLYEHLPVLGWAIRSIKQRFGQ